MSCHGGSLTIVMLYVCGHRVWSHISKPSSTANHLLPTAFLRSDLSLHWPAEIFPVYPLNNSLQLMVFWNFKRPLKTLSHKKKNPKGVVLISFCSFLGIWTRHVLNYLSSTGCLLDVSYKNNGSWVPVSMSYVYSISTKASTNLSHYILIFQSSESITGWFYCTCVDKKLKWAKLFLLVHQNPPGMTAKSSLGPFLTMCIVSVSKHDIKLTLSAFH